MKASEYTSQNRNSAADLPISTNDYTYVKIETGNGNPIWRPSVFL